MNIVLTPRFQGCFTAIITPFDDRENVDFPALDRILEQQISAGIAGVVPCGTTGESATLSFEEHKAVVRHTVEKVRKRCLVLAGAGNNSTREALELTKVAEEAGADGALLISPLPFLSRKE